VNKKTKQVVCTDFSEGKKHDFRLYKDSNVHMKKETNALTDTGYLGLHKIHANTLMPKKKSKKKPLTAHDKQKNRELSSQRASNEHVIGTIKRFKIISDRYRNRRKRFGLRFNLIAGICNAEL
jgi:DDE superfamily endonuclease